MNNKSNNIAIIAGVLAIGLIVVLVFALQAKAPTSADKPTDTTNKQGSKTVDNQANGLVSTDEVVGGGAEAVAGKHVTVNYLGTLTNGTKFDSSYDRNTPFEFNLGGGQVIKGWDQGVVGMKVGGKRKLTIPPELGYGSQPTGSIPPNSTLVFEVELLDVK